MKYSKILISLITVLMVLFMFTSCDSNGMSDVEIDAGYSDSITSDSIINGIGSSGNSSIPGDSSINVGNNGTTTDKTEEYESKIIKTANMEAQTKNFDSAITEIEAFVKGLGGYIESSNITGNNINSTYRNGRYAKYTLRVPSGKLEEFLAYTESKLHIVSTTTTSQDVSLKYYDLQSRLEVLEAEKIALNKMLEAAKTTSEMLSIRNQLTNIISDIESIKTQLKVYDSKVDYSTVTLRVDEVVEYTEIAEPDPTWWSRIKEAFVESWTDFGDWWQDFTVWIVRVFPTLIILGFFGGIAAVIIIFINKKDKSLKKKKENHTKE